MCWVGQGGRERDSARLHHATHDRVEFKTYGLALAGWLTWLEHCALPQKVEGSILSQGVYGRQLMFLSHIDVSPSLFLFPILSL